jgi:hypothetical protein
VRARVDGSQAKTSRHPMGDGAMPAAIGTFVQLDTRAPYGQNLHPAQCPGGPVGEACGRV